MATHFSILARKIPRTEEPGGLVYRIAKSWTCLSNYTFDFQTLLWFRSLIFKPCSFNRALRAVVPALG